MGLRGGNTMCFGGLLWYYGSVMGLLGEGVWYVICGHIICDGVSPIRLGHLVMVHVPNSRYAILQSYH